jgi:hypothetical protein
VRWWPLAAFLLSLAVFLLVAFPQFGATQFYGLSLDATTQQLIHTLGGSDAGSYTTLAYDFLDGRIDADNFWIINLWPPGVPFILWVIMLVNGGALPIVPLLVITGILWSLALVLVAMLLVRRGAYVVLALFSVCWLASPLLTGWTVHNGAISSDGLSAALTLVLALSLLFPSQPEFAGLSRRWRVAYFVGIGVLLGVLSLLRVTWLFATIAAFAALGLYLVIRAIIRAVRRRRQRQDVPKPLSGVPRWAAVVAGFAALAVPWTIVLGTLVHPGAFGWSAGDYQWAQTWVKDDRLTQINGYFLIDGEVNWACDLDAEQCDAIERIEETKLAPYDGTGEYSFKDFRTAAILTAVTHPLPFIAMRSGTTFESWLSAPGAAVGSYSAVPFGIVSLLSFLAACVLLVRDSIRGRTHSFLLLMFAGANVGMIWLSHFETRYLLPLHIIGLTTVAIALAAVEQPLWRRLRQRRTRA